MTLSWKAVCRRGSVRQCQASVTQIVKSGVKKASQTNFYAGDEKKACRAEGSAGGSGERLA
jgi:hypothetical protein